MSSLSQATGHPLRVLVVDDNQDTAMGLSLLMRALGHESRMTHDGLSAVEAAKQYRPNLVLLDIGLPGLSGYEVAKQLRQQATLEDSVLVAVTAWSQNEDKRLAAEAGFDHHLAKPAAFGTLQQILAAVAERQIEASRRIARPPSA
jgi:two-component system, chemotaxis family, CheB/CheR fusion protein